MTISQLPVQIHPMFIHQNYCMIARINNLWGKKSNHVSNMSNNGQNMSKIVIFFKTNMAIWLYGSQSKYIWCIIKKIKKGWMQWLIICQNKLIKCPICPILDKMCPILVISKQMWLYLSSQSKYIPCIKYQNNNMIGSINNLSDFF